MLDPQDLGRALQQLRGKRTQKEVAQKAGVDPATWSAYERGTRMPRPERLEQVAEGLGISRLELENAILERANRRMADATIQVLSRRVLAGQLPKDSSLGPVEEESAEIRRFIDERLAGISREVGDLVSFVIRVTTAPFLRLGRAEE